MDTEQFFMIPKTWLEYQQYAGVHVVITKNLYNAYCTSIIFSLETFQELGSQNEPYL